MHVVKILFLMLLLPLTAAAQLNTDHTLQVGRNALYFNDNLLAIQYFNQVIDSKPYLPEPYFLRAIAKYNLEDFTGAESDARKAVEINPFLPDAWEVRGVASQCLGNFTAAIEYYDCALSLLPHNRNILFNKALAQEAVDRFADADSTYAELLEVYPRFDDGYLGRAQLNLHRGDTISARADLDKALRLNENSVGALSLRAALNQDDPRKALEDMERAVLLQPDRVFLRVNRAVARYNANDYNGALDDLDYVLEHEPMNYQALFNRAMLRAELHDNDRALTDLNRALQLRPGDLRTRFNRALVKLDKGEYIGALADANDVVEAYPEMFAAYALRAQIYDAMGESTAARKDYRHASQIAHTKVTGEPATPDKSDPTESTEDAIARFKALQTAETDDDAIAQNFNAKGMRGRIQNRRAAVEPLPIYQLTYYTADGSGAYDREINDLNAARVLPFVVFLSNNLPTMTRESELDRHFESIQRLGAKITSGEARTLDRFARAMDYATLKDYSSALADLNAVIAAQPDFAPAYLMRSAVRYRMQEAGLGQVVIEGDAAALNAQSTMVLEKILDDLNRALDLNPRMAVAHYNRGVIYLRLENWTDAIAEFTQAIEIDPTLGAAYYNRGFAQMSRGNRDAAVSDISRSGQLGIHAAYPLLKQLQ
ncbi:MAG: tetratricopeptide repeat protein [Bacteroides sp.]|nr:tetratricopeptide repeat protein [Bacteroides sp.]MCM1379611.1 tetratricopeptide repeat protein [Bacteroides sp.]MCM1446007.1 tetratricopeptide repeat protein [Prevotella sp.]